jgi:hypothetical protein
MLFVFEGRPAICDLGSRAGTLLNGTTESLAQLNEGDLVQIGPYSIKVHFADARVEKAASESVPSPRLPAVVRPSVPDGPGDDVDLRSLEQQMATTWERWNDWQGSIRQSAALLQDRQEALLQRGAELDAQEARLRGQLHDLEVLRADLVSREGALATEREQYERGKAVWEQAQSAASVQMLTRRRELDGMAAALDQRRAELEKSAADLAVREQKLDERATQLDVRQVKFEQRERRVHEMERVMGQLQTMLGQFSALDADLAAAAAGLFAEAAPRTKPTPS